MTSGQSKFHQIGKRLRGDKRLRELSKWVCGQSQVRTNSMYLVVYLVKSLFKVGFILIII